MLGLYDQKGHLQYVGSVGIDKKQKRQVGNLTPKKTTPFNDRQPGEKSHWSGEAVGPWKPVAPTNLVEVRYDDFSDQRFTIDRLALELVGRNYLLDLFVTLGCKPMEAVQNRNSGKLGWLEPEDFARIHNVVGVDRLLDRPHHIYRLAVLREQEIDLAATDSTLHYSSLGRRILMS